MKKSFAASTGQTPSPRPIDEDALYEKLRERFDALLEPNANLFKYYKMPAKFEVELLVIMYLLGNTLDEVYERLKFVPPRDIPVVKHDEQCFGQEAVEHSRVLTTQEYEEEEMEEEELEEEELEEEEVEEEKVHCLLPEQVERAPI